MKKRPFFSAYFVTTLAVILLSGIPSESRAFLDGLIGQGKKDEVLSGDELSRQDSTAGALLAKAKQQLAAGRQRQARDTFRSIVKNYPRSEAAAEAQFQFARIRESEEPKKAFDEYQKLIHNYRNSPHFNRAIERQFTIAESLRESDKKGFLGFGAPVQPSKLIEMYTLISDSAPYSEYAPRALLSAGLIHKKASQSQEAIAKLQTVVDQYPDTQAAADAQFEIYELRGIKAERSNSPNQDRAQVEAGMDFVNQNPEDARAVQIRNDMDRIEERAVEKLFNTGKFYEDKGKPQSARVYYREVVKHPDSPFYAEAQSRLAAIDRGPVASSDRDGGGFLGISPLRKEEQPALRTTPDEVLPLPAESPE